MKTKIHYYYLNTSNPDEKETYLKICKEQKKQGLQLFDSISADHSQFYKELIKPLHNTLICLDTSFLFNNQWNTTPTKTSEIGLRVFDWSEAIYPNKHIKEGMYLEQTAEMQEIRKNTYHCNYCGKNYYLPEFEFCTSCIGSEYLTIDTLKLLKLTPIYEGYKSFDNVIVPNSLIKLFKSEHIKTLKNNLRKRNQNKINQIKKDISDSKRELIFFKKLISLGIDFNNCIYYSHTDTFTFGWRKPLTNDEKVYLQNKLSKLSELFNITYK